MREGAVKKIMKKKLLATLFILLTIINFMTVPFSRAALGDEIVNYAGRESLSELDSKANENPDNMNTAMTQGTVTSSSDESAASQTDSIKQTSTGFSSGVGILVKILVIFPKIVSYIMSSAVEDTILITKEDQYFTIQKLLSNEYNLFNIDMFKTSYTGNHATTAEKVKNSVATWYVTLRNIAAVLLVLVLIYVSIRMATSTIASQEAKYKNMLINWVVGICLLFLLHFFIIFLIKLSNLLAEKLGGILKNSEANSAELEMVGKVYKKISEIQTATGKMYYMIIYFVIVFYQAKFFLFYAYRMFKIAFMIIIAPLICVTYPIDKIKDNRAQAFSTWLQEFFTDVLIQPFQLLIYAIFIYSANELIIEMPLLGVIFFIMLGRADKIAKKALQLNAGDRNIGDIKLPGFGK